jgi:hypothetical protein
MTKNGKNIGLYLSKALYRYIAQDASVRGIPVTTWVRDVVVAACPPDVRQEPGVASETTNVQSRAGKASGRHAARPAEPRKPAQTKSPRTAIQQGDQSFDEMVVRHRDRVLELEARGYLSNAICAITHLPYQVVRHILTTRARPGRRSV